MKTVNYQQNISIRRSLLGRVQPKASEQKDISIKTGKLIIKGERGKGIKGGMGEKGAKHLFNTTI